MYNKEEERMKQCERKKERVRGKMGNNMMGEGEEIILMKITITCNSFSREFMHFSTSRDHSHT